MKAKLFFVASLGLLISTLAQPLFGDDDPRDAMFSARGCDTKKITIGGFIKTQYQYVDVDDEECLRDDGTPTGSCPNIIPNPTVGGSRRDPEALNNFKMQHIRLFVKGELGCGWSALMNIDFAGKEKYKHGYYDDNYHNNEQNCGTGDCSENDHAINDKENNCFNNIVFVDKAYIEKVWDCFNFRAGYQKVFWGFEEQMEDEYLLTPERSIATNFMTNISNSSGQYAIPGSGKITPRNEFGGRHVGLFVEGSHDGFHYGAHLVNGYQGLGWKSHPRNNVLGVFGNIAYECSFDDVEFMIGANGGYKKRGNNTLTGSAKNIYGFNPYMQMKWCDLTVMGEFLWANVDGGSIIPSNPCESDVKKRCYGDACPYGFNLIAAYNFCDNWEVVGRLSYLNTDCMGTTIHSSYCAAPDIAGCDPQIFDDTHTGRVSSEHLFNKAYAFYVGLNYYMLNKAVRASVGYEHVEYRDRARTPHDTTARLGVYCRAPCDNAATDAVDNFCGCKAKLNSIRATLQLLF